MKFIDIIQENIEQAKELKAKAVFKAYHKGMINLTVSADIMKMLYDKEESQTRTFHYDLGHEFKVDTVYNASTHRKPEDKSIYSRCNVKILVPGKNISLECTDPDFKFKNGILIYSLFKMEIAKKFAQFNVYLDTTKHELKDIQ